MNAPASTHAYNAVPVLATGTTLWAHAPEAITVVVGVLAITWYCIQIYEWVAKKRSKRAHELPEDPAA